MTEPDDGKLDTESDSGEFWVIFGGFAPISKKVASEDDIIPEKSPPKLYRYISSSSGFALKLKQESYVPKMISGHLYLQTPLVESVPFLDVLRHPIQNQLAMSGEALGSYAVDLITFHVHNTLLHV